MNRQLTTALVFGLSLGLAACSGSTEPADGGTGDTGGGSDTGGGGDTGGGDTTPPTIVSVSPSDAEMNVALNAQLRITFSEALDCVRIGNTTVVLQAGATMVAGGTSCANDTVVFAPMANLDADTDYRATVLAEVRDTAGNVLAAPFVWNFRTGNVVDTTPPVDPAVTSQVPAMTTNALETLMGSKEADANVEARWSLDGTMQHDYQEAVAIDANATWSHAFPLLDGVNVYTLRSRDSAGNVGCDDGGSPACTVTFTITKMPNQMMVNPPTVEWVTVTAADHQVISGTKEAGRGVSVDGTLVVQPGPETAWLADVQLGAGANVLLVRARDASGNESMPVMVDIMQTADGPVGANDELRVELELRDMWNFVGDEFRISNCSLELSNYSVDVWVEGPFAYDDKGTPDPNDDDVEKCFYDGASQQRLHTRYVGTVIHMAEEGQFPHWVYPNYVVPNYTAAMVEAGVFTTAAQPVPVDVDRRNPNGNSWHSENPPCGPTAYLNAGNHCVLRYETSTDIDGITSASIIPNWNRATGIAGNGDTLGNWSDRFSWDWDMTDRNGQKVKAGAYLISVSITLDRSAREQGAGGGGQAPFQFNDVLSIDKETCWDNPAHNDIGMHRAEGIILFDGTNKEVFWQEKGHAETVDAAHNIRAGIQANMQCDWDGVGANQFCDPMSPPDNFQNAPHCPSLNTATGQAVKYTQTPSGWAAPVRVQYCPGGCP